LIRLRREPLLNSILKKRKELLHVGEHRLGIIIAIELAHSECFGLPSLQQSAGGLGSPGSG
jgi:hypothetical protein